MMFECGDPGLGANLIKMQNWIDGFKIPVKQDQLSLAKQ